MVRIAPVGQLPAQLVLRPGRVLDGGARHDPAERQRQLVDDSLAFDEHDPAVQIEKPIDGARHRLAPAPERQDVEVGAGRRREAVDPVGEARHDAGRDPAPGAIQERRV